MSLRAALTNDEKARAWIGHRTMKHEQNDLALLYNVNVGRINEAIKLLDYAFEHDSEIRDLARKAGSE